MIEFILKKHLEGNFSKEILPTHVVDILVNMHVLNCVNLDLVNILHEYLIGENFYKTGQFSRQYDLATTFTILQSYSRIAPH